jgi:hypothetical protein
LLDKLNKDRDFEHMVSPEHMFQGRMKPPPPLNVKLFGPMTMPGEDPRIRKPTSSPRMDDPYTSKYCFKYMAKARDEMDEFFKQSDDMDEALSKATDEAEQVHWEDMDAEMWRVSDEAEERHPSPSLLLPLSPPLLHPHPHVLAPHSHHHTYLTLTSSYLHLLRCARLCARPPYRSWREITRRPRRIFPTRRRPTSLFKSTSLYM